MLFRRTTPLFPLLAVAHEAKAGVGHAGDQTGKGSQEFRGALLSAESADEDEERRRCGCAAVRRPRVGGGERQRSGRDAVGSERVTEPGAAGENRIGARESA